MTETISKRITLPPTPTAASLGQYGEFPVSNYTGTSSIGIPLLTASGRGLNVPVSLNYHASGIKVQQMSSWVGLGWSLSAGGVITRTVNGLADENGAGLRGSQSQKVAIQNYISCIFGAGSNCDVTYYNLLNQISNGFVDSEPDVYSFNFMGKSGKIVFDYDGVPQIIPYQKMLIDYDEANKTFTITDDLGTVYFFDQTEASQNTTTTEGYGVNGGTTAWYLHKIVSVQGEEITFTYGTETISYDQNVTNTASYEAHDFNECGSGISYASVTSNYTSQAKVLQQISTVNEDIFFELALPSAVSCYENAVPWQVATPLGRVVKKDKAGNIEMGYDFWYSCFPNSNRRLRLDSLKMYGSDNTYLPPHKFTYSETPNMPSWVNDHQDYWGYNNGKSTSNSSYLPAVSNVNIFSIYTNLEGYDREPDALEVKAFSLERITYPTGGYTDFDFEVNQYGFRGVTQNNGGNQLGAGIRIHKISSFDGTQTTGIKLFDYTLTSNPTVSSGSVITLPVYDYYSEYYVQDQNNPLGRKLCRTYQRSSHPKNFLSETQGSQVGYREVTVFEGLTGANGKTVYKYTSPYDYNDTGSNLFPFAPLTSKDHKRGLLTDEMVYQQSPTGYQLVKHTTNTYKLDETANQSTRRYVKLGIKRRSLGDGPTTPFPNVYAAEPYDYLSEWVYLTKSSTLSYFGNSVVSQEMNYTYNPLNLQPKTISAVWSGDEVFRTTYTYPNELNLALLTNRHILSVPLEIKKELDNVQIYKEAHTYGTTSIGNPVLTKVEVYPNGIETPEGKVSETYSYNDYGNIIETERNSSGVKTSYLWGYNNSRLICEARNIPYSNLLSVFNGNGLTLNEFNDNEPTTTQKTNIRSFLSGLGNTSVGTFLTYDIVKGLTHRFEPNGLLSSYAYDNFSRLRSVKDNQGNLTDLYTYQYAGQPIITTGGLALSTNKNAVVHSKFKVETTNESNFNNVGYAITNIQYLDGIGRPIQKVGFKQSQFYIDIVDEEIQYDSYGRAKKQVLPTPSFLGGNCCNGSYKSGGDLSANLFYQDLNAFSETTEFDNSPLNRPTVMYGAGKAWRDAQRNTQLFYDAEIGLVPYYNKVANGSINLIGYYPSNSLFKNTTVDEQRDTVVTLTDNQGRLINQIIKHPDGNLVTQYVYDGLNRPLAVIQPEGIGINNFSFNGTDYQKYVFAYEYDAKGRISRKHIPGGGWTSFVYDKQDQVVLEQSALQAETNLWSFSKYDALGRIAITGELESSQSQAALQTAFNGVSVPFETRSVNSYSDVSFPSSVVTGAYTERQFYYYDNYDWIHPAWAYPVGLQPLTHYADARGLQTGHWARSTENTNVIYHHVSHYDYNGRIKFEVDTHPKSGSQLNHKTIQTKNRISHSGYLSRKNVDYKLEDKIIYDEYSSYPTHVNLPSYYFHTIRDSLAIYPNYTTDIFSGRSYYDFINRLIHDIIMVNDRYNYGGLNDYIYVPTNPTAPKTDAARKAIFFSIGTVIDAQNIGNYTAYINPNAPLQIGGLQNINYSYHIRGGLLGINLDANKVPTPISAEGDLFAYKLDYETANQWDGNIGKQTWVNASTTPSSGTIIDGTRSYTYTYDPAKRLKTATYTGVGAENYSLPSMSYDKNGNITNLQRNGKNGSSFGAIDNLTYNYNGNRLLGVTDAVNGNADVGDFRDNGSNSDYTYWADGSLKSDANKGISLIEYDTFLKKVKQVTWGDGRWLKFFYDGSGKLLKRSNSTGDYWEYVGNLIFKNGVPYQLSTPEGRATFTPPSGAGGLGAWNYEFEYRDHQNNLRVAFKAENGQLIQTQASTQDPWGLEIQGLSSITGVSPQNFRFQNQEKINDFGLNWNFFKYRFADAQLGRFFQTDPLAEEYVHNSVYAFSENKVISHVELEGLEAVPVYPHLQTEMLKSVGYDHVPNNKESYSLAKDLSVGAAKIYAGVMLMFLPVEEVILGGLGLVAKEVGLGAKVESMLIKGSGSQKGIIEIGDRAKSTKAFDNLNLNEPTDFVFDPSTNRMAVATNGTNPKGHTNLTRSIKGNDKTVVGGRLKKDSDGVLQTNEWSGHYGLNWTSKNRQEFNIFLEKEGKKHTHTENMKFKDEK